MRWSAQWLIPSFVLMPFAFAWYLYVVPEAQRGLLQLGISTIGQGVFTQITRNTLIIIMTSATITFVVYFFAWRTPRDFSFGQACAILFLALAATSSTEQTREMLRKPYVIGEHMYSNGVRVGEVSKFNKEGYLTRTMWIQSGERSLWNAMYPAQGTPSANQAVPPADAARSKAAYGEMMFRGQCMSCHTVFGYRSMRRLLQGRERDAIANIVGMLHTPPETSPYKAFMPPLVGTGRVS